MAEREMIKVRQNRRPATMMTIRIQTKRTSELLIYLREILQIPNVFKRINFHFRFTSTASSKDNSIGKSSNIHIKVSKNNSLSLFIQRHKFDTNIIQSQKFYNKDSDVTNADFSI